MTEPDRQPATPSLAAVAGESPEESVRREHDLVGSFPDTGDLVPEDDAQSPPAP